MILIIMTEIMAVRWNNQMSCIVSHLWSLVFTSQIISGMKCPLNKHNIQWFYLTEIDMLEYINII